MVRAFSLSYKKKPPVTVVRAESHAGLRAFSGAPEGKRVLFSEYIDESARFMTARIQRPRVESKDSIKPPKGRKRGGPN